MKHPLQTQNKNDTSLWSPMKEFAQLRNQLFNRYLDHDLWSPPELKAADFQQPRCDVEETDQEYRFIVEMPGIPQENIQVNFDEQTLSISGQHQEERKEDNKSKHLYERYQGSLRRVFALPQNSNGEQAQATYENGVLTVSVPKKKASVSKQIKITGSKSIGQRNPSSNKPS